ncbi:MAG: single-stranded DNA-binding protein [Lachnospiraceae bacterium]|nr:single-stranded DNA-binding protein [Lachnospiraceae bacterium]
MNRVIMMGRLTADPDVRFGAGNNTQVTRFSIAVDRRFKREGDPDADFFNCVTFGKTAEFVEKYFRKGNRILIEGEVRNNNYTNKEGQKVYGTEINVNSVEFCESKGASNNSANSAPAPSGDVGDGFMTVDNGVSEAELPFN